MGRISIADANTIIGIKDEDDNELMLTRTQASAEKVAHNLTRHDVC